MTDISMARSANSPAREVREDLGGDHQHDHHEDDTHGALVVQHLGGASDIEAEATRADEAKNRRGAKGRIPIVDDDPDPRRLDLRQHRVDEGLDLAGALSKAKRWVQKYSAK